MDFLFDGLPQRVPGFLSPTLFFFFFFLTVAFKIDLSYRVFSVFFLVLGLFVPLMFFLFKVSLLLVGGFFFFFTGFIRFFCVPHVVFCVLSSLRYLPLFFGKTLFVGLPWFFSVG